MQLHLAYAPPKGIPCLHQHRKELSCYGLKGSRVWALPSEGQAGAGSRLKKYGPACRTDLLLVDRNIYGACGGTRQGENKHSASSTGCMSQRAAGIWPDHIQIVVIYMNDGCWGLILKRLHQQTHLFAAKWHATSDEGRHLMVVMVNTLNLPQALAFWLDIHCRTKQSQTKTRNHTFSCAVPNRNCCDRDSKVHIARYTPLADGKMTGHPPCATACADSNTS